MLQQKYVDVGEFNDDNITARCSCVHIGPMELAPENTVKELKTTILSKDKSDSVTYPAGVNRNTARTNSQLDLIRIRANEPPTF